MERHNAKAIQTNLQGRRWHRGDPSNPNLRFQHGDREGLLRTQSIGIDASNNFSNRIRRATMPVPTIKLTDLRDFAAKKAAEDPHDRVDIMDGGM